MTELSIRGGGETQNITKAEPHGRCTAKKKTWNGKENKHQTKEIGGGDERGISPLFTQNQAVFRMRLNTMRIAYTLLQCCDRYLMHNAIVNRAVG